MTASRLKAITYLDFDSRSPPTEIQKSLRNQSLEHGTVLDVLRGSGGRGNELPGMFKNENKTKIFI